MRRYSIQKLVFPLVVLLMISCGGGGESRNHATQDGNPQDLSEPNGLVATGVENEVILTWSPVTDAVYYNVYFSQIEGTAQYGQVISGITDTTFVHTDLENYSEYYYVYRSVNSDGIESEPSNEVMGVPQDSKAIGDRYIVSSSGDTVIDVGTGLEWKRCSVGQEWNGSTCLGEADRFRWREATRQQAPGGFRTPTVEELQTIVYCSDDNTYGLSCSGMFSSPAIDIGAFPNSMSNASEPDDYLVWTSESNGSTTANGVFFRFGSVVRELQETEAQVRLVRISNLRLNTLSVKKLGSGRGAISSIPSAIYCGLECNSLFIEEQRVTLSATADDGSVFLGWDGDCKGNSCTIVMDKDRTVTALFELKSALSDLLDERYQLLSDGSIVKDQITGLEWMRCVLGTTWDGVDCVGNATRLEWDQAISLQFHDGFRIPTIEELKTIVYCSSSDRIGIETNFKFCEAGYTSPTIKDVAFPRTPERDFWSSTAGIANCAWSVNFKSGMSFLQGSCSESMFIRLVRSEVN